MTSLFTYLFNSLHKSQSIYKQAYLIKKIKASAFKKLTFNIRNR